MWGGGGGRVRRGCWVLLGQAVRGVGYRTSSSGDRARGPRLHAAWATATAAWATIERVVTMVMTMG